MILKINKKIEKRLEEIKYVLTWLEEIKKFRKILKILK